MQPASARSRDEVFFSNGYLMLVNLIQAIALGVFITSLTEPSRLAPEKLPFLFSEFLVIVMICDGYMAGARDLGWSFDILDVLLPFLIGLFECLPMLLLAKATNEALWWFVSYSFLGVLVFAAVVNAWVKGRARGDKEGMLLLVVEGTVCWVEVLLSLMGIVSCLLQWHVTIAGTSFAVAQVVLGAVLGVSELRRRHRLREQQSPPQIAGLPIVNGGLPKAFSVRDEHEFLPIQHLMGRLDPTILVKKVTTGMHVNGGDTVHWGLVYRNGESPTKNGEEIALREAGFDFAYKV